MKVKRNNNYIAEIDGLRAVAVIAVIINHLNSDLLPGGFLGVDIFFVISGFVITLALEARWEKKSLTSFVLDFYARRAKRILPALIVYVLILSVLISLFNQDPQSSLRIGSHSLFGLSNLSLYADRSDYFAPNESLNPFLQTWSLGVEEQFYFIYPIILFCAFRLCATRRMAALSTSTIILSAASFALFFRIIGYSPSSLHYLPGFRFWEMGAGVIAYWGYKSQLSRRFTRKTGSILTVASVLGVVGCFSSSEELSRITITIVVASTAIFLSFRERSGEHKDVFSSALATKTMTRVGMISYSLYLWHWGIICIANWTIGITRYTLPLLILTMLLASYVSYKFIEQPFRNMKVKPKVILIGSVASLIAGFAAIKALSAYSGYFFLGLRARPPELPNCSGSKDSKYWIYGDSHTHEMQKTLAKVVGSSNCYRADQDFFPEDKVLGVEALDTSTASINVSGFHILNNDRGFAKSVEEHKPVFVLINKYWLGSFGEPEDALGSYDSKNLRFFDRNTAQTISHKDTFSSYIRSLELMIEQNPESSFSIIAPEPEFDWVGEGGPKNIAAGICDPQWFNGGYGTPLLSAICKEWNTPSRIQRSTHEDRRKKFLSVITSLANGHKNVSVFDTTPFLCSQYECSTHDKNGVRLYQDDDHLAEGSIGYLIKPLQEVLKEFRL